MNFPPDLPDLLRLACATGKLRLHVWFGSPNGFQANLANSAQGWTVDHHKDDCLEAIVKVLRPNFGKQLERQLAESAEQQADRDALSAADIEDAVYRAVLPKLGEIEAYIVAQQVAEELFPLAKPPVHDEEPSAAVAIDDFEALL